MGAVVTICDTHPLVVVVGVQEVSSGVREQMFPHPEMSIHSRGRGNLLVPATVKQLGQVCEDTCHRILVTLACQSCPLVDLILPSSTHVTAITLLHFWSHVCVCVCACVHGKVAFCSVTEVAWSALKCLCTCLVLQWNMIVAVDMVPRFLHGISMHAGITPWHLHAYWTLVRVIVFFLSVCICCSQNCIP